MASLPPILLRAAVLVLAAATTGLVWNRNCPNRWCDRGVKLNQHPLQAAAGLDPSHFIDLGQARARHQAGVMFVDARAEDFYLIGHIEGALSLPVADFETAFAAREKDLPEKDQELVCYCSGFGCEESVELAQKLLERGYSRVLVYLGGWPEWSEAGLPVESAP
jgi:rhodanese-related sulfurtransferase